MVEPAEAPASRVTGDLAAHHVVADRPAGVAFDQHLGAVEEACGVIAHTAGEPDGAVLKNPDPQVVPGVGVEDRNLIPSRVGRKTGQLLEPDIYGPGFEIGSV